MGAGSHIVLLGTVVAIIACGRQEDPIVDSCSVSLSLQASSGLTQSYGSSASCAGFLADNTGAWSFSVTPSSSAPGSHLTLVISGLNVTITTTATQTFKPFANAPQLPLAGDGAISGSLVYASESYADAGARLIPPVFAVTVSLAEGD